MSAKSTTHVRQEMPETPRRQSPETPVEIKIPQRMVNLPLIPSSLFRKIVLLVLAAIVVVAGGVLYFF